MELLLNKAVRYCYFTSPYFLPYKPLKKALIQAAKRGVNVKILIAGKSDVPIMKRAARHLYGQILKANIKIYEYLNKSLHAKTSIIDGIYSSIGSFNLDKWSACRNLEINIGVLDKKIAKDLKKQFNIDLQHARRISLDLWMRRSLMQKFLDWLAYQIMSL